MENSKEAKQHSASEIKNPEKFCSCHFPQPCSLPPPSLCGIPRLPLQGVCHCVCGGEDGQSEWWGAFPSSHPPLHLGTTPCSQSINLRTQRTAVTRGASGMISLPTGPSWDSHTLPFCPWRTEKGDVSTNSMCWAVAVAGVGQEGGAAFLLCGSIIHCPHPLRALPAAAS